MNKPLLRYALLVLAIGAIVFWLWTDLTGVKAPFDWRDPQQIIELIRHSGMAGPLIIISTMAVAVVLSPLPSAPIAIAAGAIYGHFEGTLYVFVGSLTGSSIAFSIARLLGAKAASNWLDKRFPQWKLSDQTRLMYIVMVSRLMPFISFDLVSYAAGVTVLSYRRFLLATAIGILPASFLLAHFGSASMDQSFAINMAILAGLLVASGLWRLYASKRDK